MKRILFFGNGITAAFDEDGAQISTLQEPWLGKYLEFLEASGEDVTTFEFTMPNGYTAKPYRTESGWNWQIEELSR